MPANKVVKKLSLLPDSENSNSFLSRFLNWITSVGRIVIVFTELIVVAVFLSRFYLDRQNADLSERIRQQRAILNSVKKFEEEFKILQKQVTVIQNLKKQANPNYDLKLKYISQATQPSIKFQNLTLSLKDGVIFANISFNSPSEEELVNFISNLSLHPQIQSVDIQRIEKKPKNNSLFVDLVVTFKPDASNT